MYLIILYAADIGALCLKQAHPVDLTVKVTNNLNYFIFLALSVDHKVCATWISTDRKYGQRGWLEILYLDSYCVCSPTIEYSYFFISSLPFLVT